MKWISLDPHTFHFLALDIGHPLHGAVRFGLASALQTRTRVEGADHGYSEYRDEVDHATRLFLDTYVRDGNRWPTLEPHGN